MNFNYKNNQHHQPLTRKENFSPSWFKKSFLISFLLTSFLVFQVKIEEFIGKQTHYFYSLSKPAPQADIQLPSLVINLKSKQGPRLARVTVEMKADQQSVKKELLSSNQSFEKHLLLVLSGQNTKDIYKKRNIFEKKIQTQINAFLSKGLINKVTLKTQLLN